MGHLQIFVYLLAILSGTIIFSLILQVLSKSKDIGIKAFLKYYIALSVLVFGFFIASYKDINIIDGKSYLDIIIQIYLKIALPAVLYFLPLFLFAAIKIKRYISTLWLQVFCGTTLFFNLFPYFLVSFPVLQKSLFTLSHHYQSLCLIVVLVYSIYFTICNIDTSEKNGLLDIIKLKLGISVFFIPLFILDMYKNELLPYISFIPKQVWYTPFYYLIWNLSILLVYKRKHFLANSQVIELFNEEVLAREYNITNREWEVINLISQGKKGSEIAKRLFITESTVKKHMQNIYEKLSVRNRVELINKLIKVV